MNKKFYNLNLNLIIFFTFFTNFYNFAEIVNIVHLKNSLNKEVILLSDVHRGFTDQEERYQFKTLKKVFDTNFFKTHNKCLYVLYEQNFLRNYNPYKHLNLKLSNALKLDQFYLIYHISKYLNKYYPKKSYSIENRSFLALQSFASLLLGIIPLKKLNLLSMDKKIENIINKEFLGVKFSLNDILSAMEDTYKNSKQKLNKISLPIDLKKKLKQSLKTSKNQIIEVRKAIDNFVKFYRDKVSKNYNPLNIPVPILLNDLLKNFNEIQSSYGTDKNKKITKSKVDFYEQNIRSQFWLSVVNILTTTTFLIDTVDINILNYIQSFKANSKIIVFSGWLHTEAVKQYLVKLGFSLVYEQKTKNKQNSTVELQELINKLKNAEQNTRKKLSDLIQKKHIFTIKELIEIEKNLFDLNLKPINMQEFNIIKNLECENIKNYSAIWFYVVIAIIAFGILSLIIFILFKLLYLRQK